ncbi:MAG TPA: hypothetical protein VJX16_13580, partial [Terriglobales bacterium]|nr:hypothetical protein [Terriglobales bacterium]
KLVLTPKAGTNGAAETTAAAGVPSRGPASVASGFAPAAEPTTASRVLLEQLRPRTMPYQPQATQPQPAPQEVSEMPPAETVAPSVAPVAPQSEVPDAATQAPISINSSVPEPVNTSDVQPVQQPSSTTPEQASPMQVLQGMYGARRAMMEQQHKAQAPSGQEQ